jgi:hypothetical protein
MTDPLPTAAAAAGSGGSGFTSLKTGRLESE